MRKAKRLLILGALVGVCRAGQEPVAGEGVRSVGDRTTISTRADQRLCPLNHRAFGAAVYWKQHGDLSLARIGSAVVATTWRTGVSAAKCDITQ